jgi:hypothetical protein
MTITLEDLRADFEAAAIEYDGPYHNGRKEWDMTDVEAWFPLVERAIEEGLLRNSAARACYIAGKLYTVARDEGLQAAMLWKLAN